MAPLKKKTVAKPRSEGKSEAFDPAKQALWSRAGFLVRRLNQIHYAMWFEEFRNESITPVQYGILTAVAMLPGSDQVKIGMEVGLDRTTTADVVKRLEKRGLLTRNVSPEDRRSKQVFVTPEGSELMGQLQSAMWAAQKRLIAPLSAKDQKTFMTLLSALVEANNQYGRAAAEL